MQFSGIWHNFDVPDQSDSSRDLERENDRLRRDLDRAERERAQLERERGRLRRANDRLKRELVLARRAGKRQANSITL